MQSKEIKLKAIRVIVKQYRHLLPEDTQFLCFFFYNNWKVKFLNSSNLDISQNLDLIPLSNGQSLFEAIISELEQIMKMNLLDQNTEYFYKIEPNSKECPIFNHEAFFECRNNNEIGLYNIIKELSISSSTLYKIESNQFIDPSSMVFIKYSLHFKKSIFRFFRRDIAQRLLNVAVNDLVLKGFIDLSQADNIKSKYLNF